MAIPFAFFRAIEPWSSTVHIEWLRRKTEAGPLLSILISDRGRGALIQHDMTESKLTYSLHIQAFDVLLASRATQKSWVANGVRKSCNVIYKNG